MNDRDFVGHLRQRGAGRAPAYTLVAVGEMIEHTAILRVQERDGNGGGGQKAEEAQPFHLQPAIEDEARRQRQWRLVHLPHG